MRSAVQIIQQQTNDDPFALWFGLPRELVLVRPDISGFRPNKMWQTADTWRLWRGEDASIVTPIPPTPTPTPSPVPTMPATPTQASPVASPVASPRATPNDDDL
jgi:hypothetical protein